MQVLEDRALRVKMHDKEDSITYFSICGIFISPFDEKIKNKLACWRSQSQDSASQS